MLLSSQAEAEEMLAKMTPDEWFGIISSRMDSMDEVETALAVEIQRLFQKRQMTQCDEAAASANQARSHNALFPALVNLVEGIKSKEQDAFMQGIVEREWHIELEQVRLLQEVIPSS